MSVAGSIEGKKDIALNSGGDLTVTALKNTESTYYQKKKSGLFASVSGGSFSVGFQKTKQTNTTDSTGWTASDITAGGDLSLASHNGTTLKGSTVAAGRDLSIDGSSVYLDALDQTGKQTQENKSFSVGLSLGLSSSSVAGQALQSALSATQASGKGSSMLQALTAANASYQVGNGIYKSGSQAIKDSQTLAQNVGLSSAPASTTLPPGSAAAKNADSSGGGWQGWRERDKACRS